MTDKPFNETAHQDWCDELDRSGAMASMDELWRIWSSAPHIDAKEARELFVSLINPDN